LHFMRKVEVSCIRKTDRSNQHERISHIGGKYEDIYWKVPIEEAISNIEKGFFHYYVNNGGHEVSIIIATNNGTKYLKTESDDTEANNLLELPECSYRHN